MHDRDFEVYLQTERNSLWLLLGSFNIIICLVTLWVALSSLTSSSCGAQLYHTVISWTYFEFGFYFWCICVLAESLVRLQVLQFNQKYLMASFLHSVVNNLWGMILYLMPAAPKQGFIMRTVLCIALFIFSRYYWRYRHLKHQKKVSYFKLLFSPAFMTIWKRLILLILIGLGLFVYYSVTSRNMHGCEHKHPSAKSNMHTVQTMVETYAVDYQGKVPHNLQLLKTEADHKHYWKEFRNPYDTDCRYFAEGNCTMMEYKSYQDRDKKKNQPRFNLSAFLNGTLELVGLPIDLPLPHPHVKYWHGLVLYQFIPPNHYRIYGTDKQGEIIQDKGQDYYLSDAASIQ